MRTIGIVPAKGTSDRLPGKNMRELAGAPLLEWTMAVAIKACDLVILTTDNLDILKFGNKFPRTICIERLKLLAHARTPDLPVVVDAYTRGTVYHQPDDVLVILRPTSPFRTAAEIREVADLVQGPATDSVRSVVRSKERPDKSYRECGYTQMPMNGARFPILEPWAGKFHKANHPRQSLPDSWRACGFIDAVRADVVVGGSMEGDSILGWPAPEERGSIDIDDADDLARAEALALQKGWSPGTVE